MRFGKYKKYNYTNFFNPKTINGLQTSIFT